MLPQILDELFHVLFRGAAQRVQCQLWLLWRLIRLVDPGETANLAACGLGIQPLAITLLAGFDRGRNVDFDEAAERRDHVAHILAGLRIGCDRRTDRDATVLGDLAGDIADAQDIDVAVLLAEPEFRRQVLAHQIAVQHAAADGGRGAAVAEAAAACDGAA